VVLALVIGFSVVGLLSNLVEGRLGLVVGSPAMLAYDVALAILLTFVGAMILWMVWRPVDSRLRSQEAALVRTVAQLEGTLSASPIGIVTVDLDGVVTGVWNAAAAEILGWSRGEVVGRGLPWVSAGAGESFAEIRQRVLAEGQLLGLHVAQVRKDGSPVELSLNSALLRDPEDRPTGILMMFADITERLREHRALIFHSSVLERLVDPVIAYDSRFEVTYWNPAAERLYGWTAAEMMGTYANARLELQPVATTLDAVRDALAHQGEFQGEFLQRCKNGALVRVEARCTTLRDDQGRVTGYVTVNRDLTERRAIEAALRESQARFERLGDNVPDVIFRYQVHPAPGYEYVSRAVTAMSGYTPEDFYRNPDLAVAAAHPEDLPRLLELVSHPESLTGAPVVLRFYRKDGTLYWTENRHMAVRDEDGRIVAVEWVARDITDRIIADERLRESEARFRQLSENAPDIVYRYRVRPTRVLEYASPSLAALSGYPLEEFYQDPDLPRRLLPEEYHHIIDTLGQRPEELAGQSVVLPWRRKDGRTVWVEQRHSLVRDAAGLVVAIEGIARDITERKELEDRLARLSQVVEQAAELVIITEVSGAIVYVNPAFERVTGYRTAEVLGQTPRILKSGVQSAELYQELWAALGRGESWVGRLRNQRKDGTQYIADAVISPVRDRSGVVVNFVGLQRDVTRESELDEQLRQAQKMEAVGQLTGGIAHDFNNLLTVILANISLVQDAIADTEGAVPRYLSDIQGAARRGADMVRKLLAFGRQERLVPRPVDLRQLVAEFLQTVGRILPATIEIHATGANDLPAGLVDPGALEQILLNLATNSRDAMPTGGTIEVRLDAATFDQEGERSVSGWRQAGHFVHLAFRDTGEGMSPESLDRVFEPFFTTKATGKGSGLGMPMVYGLMKQHHGFVTVDSVLGQGTTVHLYFPTTVRAAAEPERRVGRPELPHGTETVMLVEDEEPIRRVATLILQRLGYTVITAHDGIEALELLQGGDVAIDLLVSDVVMPRLNGPDLVARLRASGSVVPVLFATGYASSDVLNQSTIPSGASFIEKPWTVDLLARRVREAIEGRPVGQ